VEEGVLRELRLRILDGGDRDAIVELVRGLGPWVKATARTMRLEPDECEDAMQEFFTKVSRNDWRPLRAWGGEATLRGYLRVIARRTALDIVKRRGPVSAGEEDEQVSGQPGPRAIVEEGEGRRMLYLALSRLSDDDSRILTLRYFKDLGHAEIAERLRITTNAASVRLHRAEKRLEAALRAIASEEPTWN
jgi:RNA polymerase sigma-70 factor (ECF subfamily)